MDWRTYTMGYIYKITCLTNGKHYIGSTGQQPSERHKQHWKELRGGYHNNPIMLAAWQKHGEDSFAFEVVAEVSEELLLEAEDRYMLEFSSVAPRGFNCQGASRTFMTEEMRAKMSASRMGDKNPFWGRQHTEETRARISDAITGRKLSAEHRQKLSELNAGEGNSFYGKTHDDAALEKIGTASKKKWDKVPVEDRSKHPSIAAMTKANKGKKKSPEVRARMAEAARRRWAKARAEKEKAQSED